MIESPVINPVDGFSPRSAARYRRLIGGRRMRVFAILTLTATALTIAVAITGMYVTAGPTFLWALADLSLAGASIWAAWEWYGVWTSAHLRSFKDLPANIQEEARSSGIALPVGTILLESHGEQHHLIYTVVGYRRKCVLAWDTDHFVDINFVLAHQSLSTTTGRATMRLPHHPGQAHYNFYTTNGTSIFERRVYFS
jgi:hypothetical protein